MMAENPNWWSMHSEAQNPPCPPSLYPQHEEDESFSLHPLNSGMANHHYSFFPHSLSQLLLGGLPGGEEDKSGISWIEQHLHPTTMMLPVDDDGDDHHNKQEMLLSRNKSWLDHGSVVNDDEIQTSNGGGSCNWYGGMAVSSSPPKSCITTTTTSNTSILHFSNKTKEDERDHEQYQHHSPDQCDSIDTAVVSKKARVQSSSSAQPTLKVRKEKVGDRIRALHQIVSPFGKTDTASVLAEATGYIRFLHAQIEALSAPYIRDNESSNLRHQHQGIQEKANVDLKSRGLCLVPLSCTTHHIGNDIINGADYWTPSL